VRISDETEEPTVKRVFTTEHTGDSTLGYSACLRLITVRKWEMVDVRTVHQQWNGWI